MRIIFGLAFVAVIAAGAVALQIRHVTAAGPEEAANVGRMSPECDLGSAVRLTVDAERKQELLRGSTIQHTQASGGCELRVTVSEGLSDTSKLAASGTCTIDVEPVTALHPTVVQRQSGECAGIGVTIRISQQPAGGGPMALGGFGQHWMDARTIAMDPPSFPMLIVSAQINWQYDGVNVYPINYPIYRNNPPLWPFPDSFWDLVLAFSFHTIHPPGLINVYSIEHYHYTAWHSDGFPYPWLPDTDAWIKPTAWGLGNGGVICEY